MAAYLVITDSNRAAYQLAVRVVRAVQAEAAAVVKVD